MKMKKPYGLGIVVGRFQMIHAGHVDMINAARRACDSVAICIGVYLVWNQRDRLAQ